MTLSGIDVHGSKGAINWPKVAGAGHSFAFVKASEGGSFTDSRVATNSRDALAAGLFVGFYHWGRPDTGGYTQNDADAEARRYLEIVRPLWRAGHCLAALDYEEPKARGTREVMAKWALTWLHHVEGELGVRPLLYTYAPWWRDRVGNDPRFERYPLWLAAYRATPPTPPGPWERFAIWQHSSDGKVPGVPGRCDLNKFSGDRAALAALAGSIIDQEDDLTPEQDRMLKAVYHALVEGDLSAGMLPMQTAVNRAAKILEGRTDERPEKDSLIRQIADKLGVPRASA